MKKRKIFTISIVSSVSIFATILVVLIINSSAFLPLIGKTLLPSNSRDNQSAFAQNQMLKTTLKWGRLAPIPKSKTDFNIFTEGNMFSRAFRSSFYLPAEDLNEWINECPGLKDAEVENIDQSISKYVISPGDGAQYAEVVINFDNYYVEIYVYWS